MANYSHLIPKCPVLAENSAEYDFYCTVCHSDFDKSHHIPFINYLCGHTLCQPCAVMYWERKLPCPICRVEPVIKYYRNDFVITQLFRHNFELWRNTKLRTEHKNLMEQISDLLKIYEELNGEPYELRYVVNAPNVRETQTFNDLIYHDNENRPICNDYQNSEVGLAILNLQHDNKLLRIYNDDLEEERADLFMEIYGEEYFNEDEQEYPIPAP